MSLWSEIRQRRITQIVVAYLAAGWMANTVVDQLVNRAVLPEVTYSITLTLYLFGIGAASVIGWYHGEKGVQKAPAAEIISLSLIAIACAGVTVQVIRSSLEQDTLADALAESGTDLRRIGVLYFDDASADGSGAAIADGITEGLIARLSAVPELEVTSPNGAASVRDMGLAPDSVARILGVGILVDGVVQSVGDEIRVNVSVLEGESGVQLFREAYSWPSAEVASVGDQLAQVLSEELRTRVGTEIRLREARSRAPSAGSWLRVARAEQTLKEANEALAAGNLETAVAAFGRTDAELAQAVEEAAGWSEPLVLRGRVAYERHWLDHSVEDAIAHLDSAGAFAIEALRATPNDPAALELRGTASYRRWLLRVDPSETALEQTLAAAQSDLEAARDFDPKRASAFSTLSHLYYQVGRLEEAVLAARQAYRQDAFLSVADDVLWRLYSASYDLADYRQANEWCAEGWRRFPDNYRFTECRLWLMTMAGATPDVAEAWRLHGELAHMLPEAGGATLEAGARLVVGGVIGRSGLPDSADAVWIGARVGPDLDPEGELVSVEAAMRAVAGDREGAVSLLRRYAVANPGHFTVGGRLHWWWQGLVGDPEFENLRALN